MGTQLSRITFIFGFALALPALTSPGASSASSIKNSGGFLVFKASPDEVNDVTVSLNGLNVEVEDTGATPALVPTGCAPISATRVDCGDVGLILQMKANLSDEADTFNAAAVAFPVIVIGGPQGDDITGGTGGDVLIGRGGDDTLRGNTGADVLRGGFGNDALFDNLVASSPDGDVDTINCGFGADIATPVANYGAGDSPTSCP
jgi:hypothetical protein